MEKRMTREQFVALPEEKKKIIAARIGEALDKDPEFLDFVSKSLNDPRSREVVAFLAPWGEFREINELPDAHSMSFDNRDDDTDDSYPW